MTTQINPLAGKPAPLSSLIDVAKLVTAYFEIKPDSAVAAQRVVFGTSGHRGSAFDGSFNEGHVLAITQAICDYRRAHDISGPLFLGIDTHALSESACASGLEVLAANGVNVMLADERRIHTDTGDLARDLDLQPRAQLGLRRRHRHYAVAQSAAGWRLQVQPAERRAGGTEDHGLDRSGSQSVSRGRSARGEAALRAEALHAATTHRHDYLACLRRRSRVRRSIWRRFARPKSAWVSIRLGGAGVHYWAAIAEHYKLDLTVVSETVDSRFAFMTLDWDGQIRMDPSSPYAMQRLIDIKDRFQIAFACDTDHDRHGIVTPGAGLLPPTTTCRSPSTTCSGTDRSGAHMPRSARPW